MIPFTPVFNVIPTQLYLPHFFSEITVIHVQTYGPHPAVGQG